MLSKETELKHWNRELKFYSRLVIVATIAIIITAVVVIIVISKVNDSADKLVTLGFLFVMFGIPGLSVGAYGIRCRIQIKKVLDTFEKGVE